MMMSRAPIAQLDRALVSEAKGCKFKSYWAHHSFASSVARCQLLAKLFLCQVRKSRPTVDLLPVLAGGCSRFSYDDENVIHG